MCIRDRYKMQVWGGFVVFAFHKRQEVYSRYKRQRISTGCFYNEKCPCMLVSFHKNGTIPLYCHLPYIHIYCGMQVHIHSTLPYTTQCTASTPRDTTANCIPCPRSPGVCPLTCGAAAVVGDVYCCLLPVPNTPAHRQETVKGNPLR